jgi:hypothetical protein
LQPGQFNKSMTGKKNTLGCTRAISGYDLSGARWVAHPADRGLCQGWMDIDQDFAA